MASTTPTQIYGSFILLLMFGGVFGFIAVAPLVPAFASLTKEQAHVQKVWKENTLTTTTSLKTISGRVVTCAHSKGGGCDPETMKSLLEKKTPVVVWHDGKDVYQLSAQDQMILPYEHAHRGRWFAGAVSFIALIAALIQLAIRKGLIGVAVTKVSGL
jgi:hypothetical protein